MSIAFQDHRFGGVGQFREFTSLGYLGVDFFFALSGFIIFFAHQRDIGQPERISSYCVKRFIRIFPVYWIVTAVVIIGSAASAGTTRLPSSTWDAVTTLSLIRFTEIQTPVHPAWTLFHEVFFYTVFLSLLWRRRLGVFLLAAWAGSILIAAMTDGAIFSTPILRMVTAPVNVAFFAGIAAYFMAQRLTKKQGVYALIIGLCGLALWLSEDWSDFAPIASKLTLSVTFTMLLAGAVAAERGGLNFNRPILLAIGNASFMLYLTHENIQSATLKIFALLPAAVNTPLNSYFAGVILSVIFALIAYRLVEKPMLEVLRRLLLGNRKAAALPPATVALRSQRQ